MLISVFPQEWKSVCFHNTQKPSQFLRALKRKPRNFPMIQLSHLHLGYLHFNQVLCSTAVSLINLIIGWYTLDTQWTAGCERLARALLREHSPVSISQWYCIWVTAGSFCLSNLSLQLCWNRQHASLISHGVSMEKNAALGSEINVAVPYSFSTPMMHEQNISAALPLLKNTIKTPLLSPKWFYYPSPTTAIMSFLR